MLLKVSRNTFLRRGRGLQSLTIESSQLIAALKKIEEKLRNQNKFSILNTFDHFKSKSWSFIDIVFILAPSFLKDIK